jgi:RNA-directed DNA polymerase
MIDYYETKSQPITRVMVLQAYRKVRASKSSAGIDEMSWADLDKDQDAQLYKLWNRLTSGSYFPPPVKEVKIKKEAGNGVRKLGIPTILDRVAQCVIKTHLEQIAEHFHENSYGYRPGKSCHQAVEKASQNVMTHDWAIDLDIKGFFDNIDHELLLKEVTHYCDEKWDCYM